MQFNIQIMHHNVSIEEKLIILYFFEENFSSFLEAEHKENQRFFTHLGMGPVPIKLGTFSVVKSAQGQSFYLFV